MGKASISIAVSGSYNGKALERAEKSLDRLAKRAVASSDTMAKAMYDSGSKWAEAGGEIHNLGSQVESVGDSLTRGLTVPLAAAGTAAVAAATEFESAGSKIDAALGEDVSGAEALKRVGRDLYKGGWGESMDSLSDSLIRAREILGDLSETDMSYAVKGAMTLEQAYGSDLSETLRGVNVLMTKFGLSATEATDLMVSGTQRGLDYTKELGDNLSEYSGRWADAGMSASQYFSLLDAGAQNGAYQLDKVGDFLNEFLTSLIDGRMEQGIGKFSQGTQDTFEAFREGGASAQDVLNAVIGELAAMPDEYSKAQIASELWSSLGEDNAMSMITALAGVDDTFSDVSGAAQDAGDKISDNLANKAASALRTAQEAAEPFASVAVDVLGDAADAAKGAADDFSSLDEGTQGLIVTSGLLAAAVGPVLSVTGKVVQGVGDVVTMVGKAKQDVSVYADALTTTDVAALKAYEGNEKLAKALGRNPALKAAGGVKQYVDAVTKANETTADYNAAVRNLAREQKKGDRANADTLKSLQGVVDARKADMEAAKGTVEGYRASAAAAQTSTVSIKAQSVAMKAAAVAGTALKAVMATAIPAIAIAGITALVTHFQEAEEHAKLLESATDGLTSATERGASAADAGASSLDGYGSSARTAMADIDGMLESQAQLAQTIEDTNNGASAQMAQLQQAYASIQEYANQSDLSTEAQGRLRSAVETVNSLCGTQIELTDAANGVLSDENGVIQDVTASLGSYIDQKMEQIRVDAQQQNLAALYEQQATDIAELTKAQADYNAKMAEHDSYVDDYISKYGQWTQNAEESAELAWQNALAQSDEAKAVQEAQSALDACNVSIDNVSSSLTAQSAVADGSAASMRNVVMASSTVSTAMNAVGGDINDFATDLSNAGVSVSTFRSLNDQELAQLVAGWDGTAESIVSTLGGMGVEMGDAGLSAATALSNGISSGAVDVESATAVLQAAASGDWSSVASKMSEAGMSIPQGVADGISSNSFAASGAASQMLSIVALQLTGGDAVAAANLLGGDIDQGLADGILNGTLSDEAAAQLGQDVIDNAKSTLQSHSPSRVFIQLGADVDSGLSLGISGNSDGPLGAIAQLGQSLIDGLGWVPGSAQGTGSSASSMLAAGLSSGVGAVSSSSSTLASTVTSGVSGVPSKLGTSGRSASSSFASGVGSGVGSTRVSASRLASAASEMQNAGNSYTWGSHLASNFADGIRAGLGWVSSAASAIANAAKSVLGFSVPDDGPWSGAERGGETSGLHLAQNFAHGMVSGIPAVSSAADELMGSASLTGSASYGSTKAGPYRPSESHDDATILIGELVEEVRALREELGRTIADNSPTFPSDRQMKRMVQEWTR